MSQDSPTAGQNSPETDSTPVDVFGQLSEPRTVSVDELSELEENYDVEDAGGGTYDVLDEEGNRVETVQVRYPWQD